MATKMGEYNKYKKKISNDVLEASKLIDKDTNNINNINNNDTVQKVIRNIKKRYRIKNK